MRKKLVIGVAVLTAGLTAVLGLCTWFGDRSWEAYLSELRATGEPLTFGEIQARRARLFADGPTVAEVVAEVSGKLQAVPGPRSRGVLGMAEGLDIDFFKGLPTNAIETTRRYLATRRPALAQLASVQDLIAGDFGLSYNGPASQVATRYIEKAPHLSGIAQLIYIDATLRLVDGDVEAAAAAIPELVHIASPLAEEPEMLAHLNRIAAAACAVDTLENTLRVGTLDDETLQRTDAAFVESLDSQSLKWALWGERALFISSFDECRSVIPIPGLGRILYGRDKQRRGVEMIGWVLDARDDPSKLLVARSRIESELSRLDDTQFFDGLNLGSLAHSITIQLRYLAKVRAALVAIAAERFRMNNGRFPHTLDELVPRYIDVIPTDPFDGRPTKLVPNDMGLVAYSVGDDGIDDGGSVVPAKARKRPLDRGFRLLNVDERGVSFIDPAARDP